MKLWIVGKNTEDFPGLEWEFIGVFDSEDKARAACTSLSYFFGPAELNEALPDETAEWPGITRPLGPDDNFVCNAQIPGTVVR